MQSFPREHSPGRLPSSDVNRPGPPRSECFVCQRPAVTRCLRCEGRLCTEHTPLAERRCLACEWLGYHLRWLWRDVLLWTAAIGATASAVAFVFHGSWLTYVLGLPALAALYRWRPLGFLDTFKRRRFLAERLPGLWYEYAIKLRSGKVKPRRMPEVR